MFLAGQATVDRAIVPVNDALIEGTETVSLTIVDGANYDVGAPVTGIGRHPRPADSDRDHQAVDPTASETGLDPGMFRFTRVGDVSLPLTVTYVRTGSASPTSDFASFGPSIVIPAGAATVDRVITPVAPTPAVAEGSETVVLTLVGRLPVRSGRVHGRHRDDYRLTCDVKG